MNISGVSASATLFQKMEQPSAEDIASQMISAVENGDIDAETLLANLESRFGEGSTEGILSIGTLPPRTDSLSLMVEQRSPKPHVGVRFPQAMLNKLT